MMHPVVQAFHTMRIRPADQWMRNDPAACASIEANILDGAAQALPSLDNPAVIGGIVHRHGVGTAWMVVGEGFEASRRIQYSVLVTMRSLCRSAVEVFKLRRLQMLVAVNEPAHRRFARAVGFYQESVLPHVGMGPRGEDILIFNWNRGE